MGDSSDHKSISVRHRGYIISIRYWIDYSGQRKIVKWDVKEPGTGIYTRTVKRGEYTREPLGGERGIFGFGARPERSFHELIADAIEEAAQYINETSDRHEPPEPDEIAQTLEIRGYEVADE
ncbi:MULTISPECIES: hypothetical protein [Actinomycetes]|uniref:hypothetical protein n=1 Tax=Aeromicrobium tamlense TaxID=375541 RepID=UPI0031E2AD3B